MGRLLDSVGRAEVSGRRVRLGTLPRRGVPLVVAVLAGLLTAGCVSGRRTSPSMGEYGEIMRGRQPCNCAEGTPWCDYLSVMRGETPCPTTGRARCTPDCGCPPKPCGCGPVSAAPAALPVGASRMPTDLPAQARPGEAWCRVHVPAKYETRTESVVTQCATETQVWVPPVYETRVRQVLVQPARTSVIELPALTRSVETCETCAPARTETVARTVADACGRCVTTCEPVQVPPVTRTRLREVAVVDPSRSVVFEPAVYTAEVCEVEVKPGRFDTLRTPEVRETVMRRVCVAPERWEWVREAACDVPGASAAPAK